MWTYYHSVHYDEDGILRARPWIVGFSASGDWHPFRECGTQQQAVELVQVLNRDASPAHVADLYTREEALR